MGATIQPTDLLRIAFDAQVDAAADIFTIKRGATARAGRSVSLGNVALKTPPAAGGTIVTVHQNDPAGRAAAAGIVDSVGVTALGAILIHDLHGDKQPTPELILGGAWEALR